MRQYSPKNYEQTFEQRYYEANRRSRVGRFLGRLALREHAALEERLDEELMSGFIEALDGDVVMSTPFDVVDGYVVSKDGERLWDMLLRCRKYDYEVASINPEMEFVTLRSEAEINELNTIQSMIRRGVPNSAIVTFSPYTTELVDRPDLLKKGYQRPDRKRSMLRISVWDGHKLHMINCSLDWSDLDSLRAVCRSEIGLELSGTLSHEILSQQIMMSLTPSQALELARTIQREHKKQVNDVSSDAAQAIQSRPDIFDSCKREIKYAARDSKTYQEFLARKDNILYEHLATYSTIIKGGVVSHDISQALADSTERAVSAGETYSMCGDEVSSVRQVPGVAPFESIMRLSNKLVKCPNTGCGKMVVIEDKYLRQGILHCHECNHTIDVCGDMGKANRIKQDLVRQRKTRSNHETRHPKSSQHKGILTRIYQM